MTPFKTALVVASLISAPALAQTYPMYGQQAPVQFHPIGQGYSPPPVQFHPIQPQPYVLPDYGAQRAQTAISQLPYLVAPHFRNGY